MQEVLNKIWIFEYAIVPCLLAYLLFDLPIIYRRVTRRIYVPVYFAFFPFGYSDELYARYFDEDIFCMVGGSISSGEVANTRNKIIWTSVLSLALTMAISPFAAALFCYYFLSPEQQVQFFYTLAIFKGATLLKAVYDLRWQYKITDVIPIGYISTIYALYWVAILTFYDRGLKWIAEKDEVGGFTEIANSLLDFFVYDIGVEIVFVAVLGVLLPWRLTKGTARPIEEKTIKDE